MDKIEIKNLEIFANHGVFPEENVLGQKFVISATLYTDTRKAGLTDELTASIHYGEVSHMITKFTKEHTYKLLEALAENLCQMLLQELPLLKMEVCRITTSFILSGIIGRVSISHFIYFLSYSSGSASVTRCPRAHVTTYSLPSRIPLPFWVQWSTLAISLATDGFSAITNDFILLE